jgi:hypothetical protein
MLLERNIMTDGTASKLAEVVKCGEEGKPITYIQMRPTSREAPLCLTAAVMRHFIHL